MNLFSSVLSTEEIKGHVEKNDNRKALDVFSNSQ